MSTKSPWGPTRC